MLLRNVMFYIDEEMTFLKSLSTVMDQTFHERSLIDMDN